MDINETFIVKKLIAHRGVHGINYPENSLAAFERAIEFGFAIELDVQMISDGTVVVIHDETLDRTTNRKGAVKDLKRTQLKNTLLENTTQFLPTFKEVLNLVDGRTPILVEIKNTGTTGELEQKVYEILKKYNGEYAVQSFNPFSLKWFKENAPEVFRGQLSGWFKKEKSLSPIKRYILRTMMLNKRVSQPHFLAYDYKYLPNRFTRRYQNIPVLAYTIQNQKTFNKVKQYANNIIFDKFIPTHNKEVVSYVVRKGNKIKYKKW